MAEHTKMQSSEYHALSTAPAVRLAFLLAAHFGISKMRDISVNGLDSRLLGSANK